MKSIIEVLKKREFTLIALILGLVFIVTLRAPGFVQGTNIERIVNDTAILIIVALGQFLVILTGGIDLSIASTIAFSGMVASMLNQYFPAIPVPVILIIGVSVGLLLGLFNATLVAIGKIPPIIATLGTMSIYRGFTFVLSKGQWVTAHEMTESYMNLPKAQFLGIPNLIWTAVIISLLLFYFIRYTKSGREIYAIGGNKNAALFSGVSSKKVNLIIFTICGGLAGLGGVMWTARYAAAVNETAMGFELMAVAACVIGGVNIAGGYGTVPGVILGALFIGIINNALPVVDISPFLQMFIQGVVVLLAMFINVIIDQRKEKKLLQGRNR